MEEHCFPLIAFTVTILIITNNDILLHLIIRIIIKIMIILIILMMITRCACSNMGE